MGRIINKQGQISGMGCSSCADKIQQTLISQNGVLEVDIDFSEEIASIKYKPEVINEQLLVSVIEELGYGLSFDAHLHDKKITHHSSHHELHTHSNNKQNGIESHTHSYLCPMKCEGEKVYDSPGI